MHSVRGLFYYSELAARRAFGLGRLIVIYAAGITGVFCSLCDNICTASGIVAFALACARAGADIRCCVALLALIVL